MQKKRLNISPGLYERTINLTRKVESGKLTFCLVWSQEASWTGRSKVVNTSFVSTRVLWMSLSLSDTILHLQAASYQGSQLLSWQSNGCQEDSTGQTANRTVNLPTQRAGTGFRLPSHQSNPCWPRQALLTPVVTNNKLERESPITWRVNNNFEKTKINKWAKLTSNLALSWAFPFELAQFFVQR